MGKLVRKVFEGWGGKERFKSGAAGTDIIKLYITMIHGDLLSVLPNAGREAGERAVRPLLYPRERFSFHHIQLFYQSCGQMSMVLGGFSENTPADSEF